MSGGGGGVILVPVALAAAPVLAAAGVVYGIVQVGRTAHDVLLEGQQCHAKAEKLRHARLTERVAELANDAETLGIDSISGAELPSGQLDTIASASSWARAMEKANDALEARVNSKASEVAEEKRLMSMAEARIAAARSERDLLERAAGRLAGNAPQAEVEQSHSASKASDRAKMLAESLLAQNADFQAKISTEFRAQKQAEDHTAFAAMFEDRDFTALIAGPTHKEQRLAAERRDSADKIAEAIGALPVDVVIPATLHGQIEQLRNSSEPPKALLKRVLRGLANAAATASLREHLRARAAAVKERATAIQAFEFHTRVENAMRSLAVLPEDADWDARRGVELEVETIERDLAEREADQLAIQARVVALTALYESFTAAGLGISGTAELGMWKPEDGELKKQASALEPDEVLVRVRGTRKAVRVKAHNVVSNPARVQFSVDQVWLGQRDDPDSLDASEHDRVCEAIDAALKLLPEAGVELESLSMQQTPFDHDIPVISLGHDLNAILEEEVNQVRQITRGTEQGQGNVRRANEP